MKYFFLILLLSFGCSFDATKKTPNEETCLAKECVVLAIGFENAPEANLEKAYRAYQRGCKLGDAHACGSAGMMQFYGHGIHSNVMLGMSILSKSCEANYGQACANLGIIYSLGRAGEIDNIKAKAMFEKGCHLKSETACEALKSL